MELEPEPESESELELELEHERVGRPDTDSVHSAGRRRACMKQRGASCMHFQIQCNFFCWFARSQVI